MKKFYRSKDGRNYFNFDFVSSGSRIDIFCSVHPSLNERDSDVNKTHIFSSGQLCFVTGREPRTQRRAEELARQWAEYYISYARTGVAQL